MNIMHLHHMTNEFDNMTEENETNLTIDMNKKVDALIEQLSAQSWTPAERKQRAIDNMNETDEFMEQTISRDEHIKQLIRDYLNVI